MFAPVISALLMMPGVAGLSVAGSFRVTEALPVSVAVPPSSMTGVSARLGKAANGVRVTSVGV